MTDPAEKGATPKSKGKGKSSLLDKEFLGSWNSALGSDDSSMDFNFESAPKGSKMAFNFDKLDMDFSLDGEFDKIKSFKMDMSEPDFSPPKDSTKATVKKSTERKEDPFGFSFDFNDLDNFDFDSVLPKGEMKLHEEEGSKKVDSSDNSRVLVVDAGARVQEPSTGNLVSLDACTSKSETSVVRQSIRDNPDNGHVSKSPSQIRQTEPIQGNLFPQREGTVNAEVSDHKDNNVQQTEVDSSDEQSTDGSSNMEAVSSKDVPPSKYDCEKFPMNNNIVLEQEGSHVMAAVEMADTENANKQRSELGSSEDGEVSAKDDSFVEYPSANVSFPQRGGSFMEESTLAKEKTLGELSSTNFSRPKSILSKVVASGTLQAPSGKKLVSFNPNIMTSVRSGGRDSARVNEVDRITSSKMNMRLPGISSPPKDSTKENVRPERESFKSNQTKDLDNHSYDSAWPKGEKKLGEEEGGKKVDSGDILGSDDSRIVAVNSQGIVQEPSRDNVVAGTSKPEKSMMHPSIHDHSDTADIFKSPTQSFQVEPRQSKSVPQRDIAGNAQETDQKGDNRQQREIDSPNEKASNDSSSMQGLSGEDVPLSKPDFERFTMDINMSTEQENSHSMERMQESEKFNAKENELESPEDSAMRAMVDSSIEDPSANVRSVSRLGSLMAQSSSAKENARGDLSSAHFSSFKSVRKKDKALGPLQGSTSGRKLVSFHQNTLHSSRSDSIKTYNKAEGGTVAGKSTSYTRVVHDRSTSGSQIHSSVLSQLGSQTGQQNGAKPEPNISKPAQVIDFKLPSLKERKMIPDLSKLRISSMSALEARKSMRSPKGTELLNATMGGKLTSAAKPLLPNPFLKRKTDETASEISPATFHLAKRRPPNQNSSFLQASEHVTDEPTAYKLQKPVNMPRKPSHSIAAHSSDEQPESTFELIPKNSEGKDRTSVIDLDEIKRKAEAYGNQLDEICNVLRRNQKEAQNLLVRSMVNNNRLLLLNQSIHDEKLHEVQNLAAKLMSKYFPERA